MTERSGYDDGLAVARCIECGDDVWWDSSSNPMCDKCQHASALASAHAAGVAEGMERAVAACQRIAQRYESDHAAHGEFDTIMERVAQECAAAIREAAAKDVV